jgi:hypothetical protein
MPRSTLVTLHAASGAVTLVTICAFWLSAFAAELVLTPAGVVAVRTAILYALPVLVAALAVTGGSGARLAGRSKAPLIRAKQRRMAVAAANGLLVLVPSAIFLGWRAQTGDLGGAFAIVQIVELVAGAANIVLLGLNMRAGTAMRGLRAQARTSRGMA